MEQWFVIKDFDSFIDSTRILVFVNFGSQKPINDIMTLEELSEADLDELNKVLSYDETTSIAKAHMIKQRHKKSNKLRYILSDTGYHKIVSDLNTRMVSNLMIQLVNKGLVETAFDDNTNDFIFWIKEENAKNQEKPETD